METKVQIIARHLPHHGGNDLCEYYETLPKYLRRFFWIYRVVV